MGSWIFCGWWPVGGAWSISLDTTKLDRVIDIDTENMHVTVEAGKNGGILEDQLQSLGLTLNHSPQSLYRSTVGGWLATRATGQFSSRYGGIEDLCGFQSSACRWYKSYGRRLSEDGSWARFAAHFNWI